MSTAVERLKYEIAHLRAKQSRLDKWYGSTEEQKMYWRLQDEIDALDHELKRLIHEDERHW